MACTNPITFKGELHPCRKRTCLPCMQARSAEWAGRMKDELKYWKDEACFITLTYAPHFLPRSVTVMKYDKKIKKRIKKHYYNPVQGVFLKSDYQNFIKLLRYYLRPKKIKYRICGEYGKIDTKRVHYHVIIFGLSALQKVYYPESYIRRNPALFLNYYYDINPEVKELIKKCWDKGRTEVSQVIPERITYLEKYIEKRHENDKPFGYEQMPSFSVGSLGMGLRYALDNKKDIDQHNGVIGSYLKYDVLNKNVRGYRPAKVDIPACDYYLKKIFTPNRVQEIKKLRTQKVIEEMRKVGAKNPTDVQRMSTARAISRHAESEQIRRMFGNYRREILGDCDD